jgi:hypothetical protein
MGGSARRVDHRLDVLDLSLDRVGRRVPAVASAAAVIVQDGEVG